MSIRNRNGKWEWRFWVDGQEYSEVTDLGATKRNEAEAHRREQRARDLVEQGKGHLLRIQVRSFNEAAEQFLIWAKGEYREHPNSAKRLAGSFASLIQFFGRRPVSAITAGALEDFKAWRRRCPTCGSEAQEPECRVCGGTGRGVEEVTIRHDLHALSKFFTYAQKHNWTRANPVKDIKLPSDADAVRIHPVTPAEEAAYFGYCLANGYQDLHDCGRLMLLQGPRPDELYSLPWSAVNLEAGTMLIARGKSRAARRSLRLVPESREILARRLREQAAGSQPLYVGSRPSLGGKAPQHQARQEMSGSPKWVFPSPVKPGCHLVKLNAHHDEVIEATGLRFVLYDFRHTFATRAIKRGVDLPTLKALMGHSSLRSLMHYVHIDQADMDAAMLRLAEKEREEREQLATEAQTRPEHSETVQ